MRAGPLVGSVERPAPQGTYLIFDYACELTGGTAHPGDDALDVAWVDAATFTELETAGALVPQLADTLREWRVI